jgi:hypothetical protein
MVPAHLPSLTTAVFRGFSGRVSSAIARSTIPMALRKSLSEPAGAAILSALSFCQEIPAPCRVDVV